MFVGEGISFVKGMMKIYGKESISEKTRMSERMYAGRFFVAV